MGFEEFQKGPERDAVTEPCTRCKYCQSAQVVKAGTRKLKTGVRQMFKCTGCGRRFSNLNRSDKRTHPAAILDALTMVCQGRTYEETIFTLRKKHRLTVTRGAISKWVREYKPDYLKIRHLNQRHGQIVRSYLFTHGGINYNYKLHLPKLATCPFAELKSYLLKLPEFIDHAMFEKGPKAEDDSGLRASQLVLTDNHGLREFTDTRLRRAALDALSLALSNRQRHQVVEDYLLSCDRNTIAVEVPVYFHHAGLGSVTGHVDILQINFGKVRILDFKPHAKKENPAKVMTQLTLYAMALTYRAKLKLADIVCAYFDEERMFQFRPRWIGRAKASQDGVDGGRSKAYGSPDYGDR